MGEATSTRRPIIAVVALIPVLAGIVFFFRKAPGGAAPPLPVPRVNSIELFVGENHIAITTNTAQIISILRTGREVPPHACAALGRAILRFETGEPETLFFYPGHSSAKYEFSFRGRPYVVSRDAFFSAFRESGVDVTVLSK